MQRNRKRHVALIAGAIGIALVGASPSRAGAQERVYAASELSQTASVKSKSAAAAAVERHYPPALQRIGGKVQLQFVVEANGRVDPESIKVVVASATALGEAATRAIRQVEFVPGMVDGKPVRSLVAFPVTFAGR